MALCSFQKYFNQLNESQYRIELAGINSLGGEILDGKTVAQNLEFLRSDHARFWYLNSTVYNKTIPAVLITDTGNFLN